MRAGVAIPISDKIDFVGKKQSEATKKDMQW